MKILVDMNLSPDWVDVLEKNGFESVHWSNIGKPNAEDHELIAWARSNSHVVFTHDLDFGTLLALTNADSPSVIQARTQDVSPEYLGKIIISVLKQYEGVLESGALIVVDESRSRIRVLPLS